MKSACLLVIASLALAGCTKEMGDQPKIKTFTGHPAPPPAGAVSQESAQPAPVWPAKPTRGDLERGKQRYNIYCSVCHGLAGDGDGMVVQRGFPKPLAFTDPSQLKLSREQIENVIAQGAGRMSAMSEKLSPSDRQKVAMYVKALQLSQTFPQDKLNETDRARLKQ